MKIFSNYDLTNHLEEAGYSEVTSWSPRMLTVYLCFKGGKAYSRVDLLLSASWRSVIASTFERNGDAWAVSTRDRLFESVEELLSYLKSLEGDYSL